MLMHWPKMVYHFHREGFDLPRGAELLAEGDTYPNQAFRYSDNAWGLQFHAELTRAMMHRWVVHGAHRFILPERPAGSRASRRPHAVRCAAQGLARRIPRYRLRGQDGEDRPGCKSSPFGIGAHGIAP